MTVDKLILRGRYLAKTAMQFYHVNQPLILTGIGLGGFIFMAPTAIRGKAVADQLFADLDNERDGGPLTKKDKAVVYAKAYWPTALSYSLSAACIIAGQAVQLKRLEALDALVVGAQRQLAAYQKSVEENGPKAKRTAIERGAIDNYMDSVAKNSEAWEDTGAGDTLCIDLLTGRKFKSNIETVRKAFNDFNIDLRDDADAGLDYTLMNQFYYRLGLSDTELGNMMGWSFANDRTSLELVPTSRLDENGNPMLGIGYSEMPTFVIRD